MTVATKTRKELTVGEKNDLNAANVKSGDLMRFTYWAVVDRKAGRGDNVNVQVTNVDTDSPFSVHGSSLIEGAYSADQYEDEEKVTATKIAELFFGCWRKTIYG